MIQSKKKVNEQFGRKWVIRKEEEEEEIGHTYKGTNILFLTFITTRVGLLSFPTEEETALIKIFGRYNWVSKLPTRLPQLNLKEKARDMSCMSLISL